MIKRIVIFILKTLFIFPFMVGGICILLAWLDTKDSYIKCVCRYYKDTVNFIDEYGPPS